MAIKINNTTVINDDRNIQNIGVATADAFKGSAQVGIATSSVYLGLTTQFNFVGSGITITPTYNAVAGITTLTFVAGAAGGGSISISDDTTTNATRHILFDDATSGTVTSINVSSTKLTFNPSTGTLSATVFTSLSDETQKTNIQPIQNAVKTTQQLNGVTFNWKDNHQPSLGLIAQEVEKVIPEVVNIDSDGIKSVNYGSLIGLLVEAIKEQQIRIDELEERLNA